MTPRYICATCGGFEEDENGMCVHGHDNWMELGGLGILPDQVEEFKKNVGLPISVAYAALSGDNEAINTIMKRHEEITNNDVV